MLDSCFFGNFVYVFVLNCGNLKPIHTNKFLTLFEVKEGGPQVYKSEVDIIYYMLWAYIDTVRYLYRQIYSQDLTHISIWYCNCSCTQDTHTRTNSHIHVLYHAIMYSMQWWLYIKPVQRIQSYTYAIATISICTL